MARYRYAGPGPTITGVTGQITGAILRPGDVCEFDEEPAYGPWELLDEPEAETTTTPITPAPTPPAIGLSALTTPPAGKEGM